MLRLLGLCGVVLLVGALLTPPDPFSHWLFSLPLVALHVLATLAGRAFAGKTAAEFQPRAGSVGDPQLNHANECLHRTHLSLRLTSASAI